MAYGNDQLLSLQNQILKSKQNANSLSASVKKAQDSISELETALRDDEATLAAHTATLADHTAALDRIAVYAVNKEFTVNASNVATVSINATRSDGKTPFGIVGWYVSGTGESFIHPYKLYLSSGNVQANLRNYGTSNFTVTLYAYVLYH